MFLLVHLGLFIGLPQCSLSVAVSNCFYGQMLTFLWLFDLHVLFDALEMKDQFLDLWKCVCVS